VNFIYVNPETYKVLTEIYATNMFLAENKDIIIA